MKIKLTIKDMTHGEYYSLQDVSDTIHKPKNIVYSTARALGMDIIVLFNKYTVFSKAQVTTLRQEVGNGA